MNKREKIIYTVFFAVMLILLVYILLTQGKVKAAQEVIEAQAKIQELNEVIENAKNDYAIAESSKNECITSRNEQKEPHCHNSCRGRRNCCCSVHSFCRI